MTMPPSVAVLRIGHRLVRDDRTTTHAVLVSRAMGSEVIYMTDVDDEIKKTLDKVNKRWGGENEFRLEIIDNWKKILKKWKENGGHSCSSYDVWSANQSKNKRDQRIKSKNISHNRSRKGAKRGLLSCGL